MPSRDKFGYTFDKVAHVIDRFTEVIGFDRFAVYVFDYGAPTGFRLAVRHPERITAIISQNGNAYEEGLSEGWSSDQGLLARPVAGELKALRAFLTPETTRWQYTHGVPDQRWCRRTVKTSTTFIWPVPVPMKRNSTCSAITKATSPCIQHSRNTSAHTSRRFWRWGQNDPFFLPAGAEALKRDNPRAVVSFRHRPLCLEMHAREIAESIRRSPEMTTCDGSALSQLRDGPPMPDPFHFKIAREKNRLKSVAIVTGASSGIGKATALWLACDFGSIVLVARNGQKLDEPGRPD